MRSEALTEEQQAQQAFRQLLGLATALSDVPVTFEALCDTTGMDTCQMGAAMNILIQYDMLWHDGHGWRRRMPRFKWRELELMLAPARQLVSAVYGQEPSHEPNREDAW